MKKLYLPKKHIEKEAENPSKVLKIENNCSEILQCTKRPRHDESLDLSVSLSSRNDNQILRQQQQSESTKTNGNINKDQNINSINKEKKKNKENSNDENLSNYINREKHVEIVKESIKKNSTIYTLDETTGLKDTLKSTTLKELLSYDPGKLVVDGNKDTSYNTIKKKISKDHSSPSNITHTKLESYIKKVSNFENCEKGIKSNQNTLPKQDNQIVESSKRSSHKMNKNINSPRLLTSRSTSGGSSMTSEAKSEVSYANESNNNISISSSSSDNINIVNADDKKNFENSSDIKNRKRSNSKNSARRWTEQQDLDLKNAVQVHNGQNWKAIAKLVAGRDHVQCLQRWKKVLQPGLVKGMWSKTEDDILLNLMNTSKPRNWADIAFAIPGRTAKQCRERWSLNLDPSINRLAWSEEEDNKLIQLHSQMGNRWAEMKRMLPGRTENAVKTRFKSIERSRAKDKNVIWTKELELQLQDIAVRFNGQIDQVAKHLPRSLRGISSQAMRDHCPLLKKENEKLIMANNSIRKNNTVLIDKNSTKFIQKCHNRNT